MKLLLVDANEAFSHRLRGDLLRSGAMLCDLELALSYTDAIRQLDNERFDAILIDPTSLLDAPGSIYRDLQQLAQRAPILVLSADSDDAAAVDAVRQGAHDVLTKNHTQTDWLLRRVRYAIDRQRGETARAKLAGPHASRRTQAHAPQFAHMAQAGSTTGESASLGTSATYADATSTVDFYRDDFGGEDCPDANVGGSLPAAAGDVGFAEVGFAAVGSADVGSADIGLVDACVQEPFSIEDGQLPRGANGAPGWRVLHIESDPVFLTLSDKMLRCDSPYPLTVTHAGSVAEATRKLASATYDAVLVDLSLPDSSGLDSLTAVLRQVGEAPVLVITANDEAATAVEAMRCGAEDFLRKSEPDMRYLRRATQLAIVRRDRALRMPPSLTVENAVDPVKPVIVNTAERRRHTRYSLTKPIFATPVLPDGSPAATYSADGFSVDVSEGGLRFEIGNLQRLPTTHLLVGIEGLDTVLYFATVEARHVVPKGNGLDVGAQFAKGARDLIRPENLEPSFNLATGRFETGLPLDVITKWVDFGIFRPALFDRQFVCPQCRAIPTFRNGCRVCGSVRLHSRPLIHHFACAHVGYVSDFEQNGTIICPKCRTRNLIVGADFEHLNGPYHCLDCDWSDTDLDTVGQCMKCELRFPMAQAIEEDLIGYHVNRLDPLAFINAG